MFLTEVGRSVWNKVMSAAIAGLREKQLINAVTCIYVFSGGYCTTACTCALRKDLSQVPNKCTMVLLFSFSYGVTQFRQELWFTSYTPSLMVFIMSQYQANTCFL